MGMSLFTQLWLRVCRVDLARVGRKLEETITTIIKYKSNRLGPKTLTNIFSTQKELFQGPLMEENSPLDVSVWIRRLGPLWSFLHLCIASNKGGWASSLFSCQLLGPYSTCFPLQWSRTMPHYRRIWCHHEWIRDWQSHFPYFGYGSPFLAISCVRRSSCYNK